MIKDSYNLLWYALDSMRSHTLSQKYRNPREIVIVQPSVLFFYKMILVQKSCKQFTSCNMYSNILVKSANQFLQC